MTNKYKIPWDIGALFICTKCGAKFNQPELAEQLKTDIRKQLKVTDQNKQIRVMTSGCLNVCYPEEQTFSFMPQSGQTEIYTTALDHATAQTDILEFIKTKI